MSKKRITNFQEEKGNSVMVTIRLPPILLSYFDKKTKPKGYSRQEAIRESMRRFVNYGK